MTATSIYIFILHLGSVNVWETPELKELCKKLPMKNGEPYVEITKLSQDEQKVIAEAIRGAVVYRKYLSLVKALAVAEQEQKAKNPARGRPIASTRLGPLPKKTHDCNLYLHLHPTPWQCQCVGDSRA